LHELAASEATGQAVRTLTEDEPQGSFYRELELQGLMVLEPPRSYRLTYAGHEALGLFDAMHQAALIAPLDQLENDWRFLGSDILAALQAAARAPTFAITEPEGELLATIHQLSESAKGAQRSPDKKMLHRVLVDRMAKRYQNFIGRYGRTVRERSARKRQALAMLEQIKEHDKWSSL
jgi:hypothetical protein